MNVAFTQRVAEQVDAKNKLQSHLNRVSLFLTPITLIYTYVHEWTTLDIFVISLIMLKFVKTIT